MGPFAAGGGPLLKACLVSVDVENDAGTTSGEPTFGTIHGTDLILDVCAKHGARPTLFVTGELLDRYPERVRAWRDRGAEIATHGYRHVTVPSLSPTERRSELERTIAAHERHLRERPRGYRAVQHGADAQQLRLVNELGFAYDASVMPRYPPFRSYVGYKGRAPIVPYHPSEHDPRQRGMLPIAELPNTGAALDVPLYGTWMRVLGERPMRALVRGTGRAYLSLAAHNWDAVSTTGRYAQNCGAPFLRSLDKMLGDLARRRYQLLGYEAFLKAAPF